MDHFRSLEVFIAIAEEGSLSAAARRLGVSAPSVTRLLGDLEDDIGVPLVRRTTRSVTLTDTGVDFLQRANKIVRDYQGAIETARGASSAPKGVLRITASTLFGNHYVAPIILNYLNQYNDVEIEAVFVDRVVNIVEEGFDVAIRIGPLADSNFMATRVGEVRSVICACPSYFGKYGLPQNPTDLKDFAIIAARAVTPTNDWRFANGQVVKVRPRLAFNTVPGAITAAKQSWGVTRVLSYQIGPDLGSGGLKTVLGEFEPEALPIHIVHPEGRAASAKVRAFVDMISDHLRANPFLNK